MFDFAFLLMILTKYYVGDEIKEEEMGRACGTFGAGVLKNGYRVLLEKLEGKRPCGRARCTWEGMYKINLAQDTGKWQVMNLLLP
jgi:hypothetical protein